MAVPATTRHEMELARLRYAHSSRTADGIFSVLRTVVRSGAWVLVAYFGYRTMAAIAGKTTDFNAAMNGFLRLSADRYVAWLVAALCGFGYVRQRKLRRRTIEGQEAYIRQLERAIDPRRSGSGLTSRGIPKKEILDAP